MVVRAQCHTNPGRPVHMSVAFHMGLPLYERIDWRDEPGGSQFEVTGSVVYPNEGWSGGGVPGVVEVDDSWPHQIPHPLVLGGGSSHGVT